MKALGAALVVAVLLPPASYGWAGTAEANAPTPVLLERAVARGELARAEADRYLVLALTEPDLLPVAYRSDVPWEGTTWLLAVRRRLEAMPPSPDRAALRQAIAPLDNCDGLGAGSMETDTAHFHVHHPPPGTTDPPIANYFTSLETTWSKEVDAYGWAAPPLPGTNRYLVVVAPIGPVFGFVVPTAVAGDNPNTSWNDRDAFRSCMVLNSNFSAFPPSNSQQALDSTTAHEFNHSIQFGYGALSGGTTDPDYAFVEGMATWMEDEVFDDANDNYRYLWPDLTDEMGEYRNNSATGNPYGYWAVWRALVERFGAGVPGGGEDVIQRFWELTSQEQAHNLDAMHRALAARGVSLADAFLDAGVALRFNRACGGGYAVPYCLEEGPFYVGARGPAPIHRQISGVGGSASGQLLDNYSLHHIALPAPASPFQVRLRNSAQSGRLMAAVACDTGAALRVAEFRRVAGPGRTVILKQFDTTGCVATAAVVANVHRTADNPSSSEARSYQLTVAPPPKATKTTLRVRRSPGRIVAVGRLTPKHPGKRMDIVLFERDGKRWDRVDRERPRLKGPRYRAAFDRRDAGRCRIRARFPGHIDHLPSQRIKSFSC
jgi:hypothetical protein